MLKNNDIKIYGDFKNQTSIISFNIEGIHFNDLAMLLDKKNIAITAGASAPEVLIKQLTTLIQSHSNAIINEIDGPKENIVFKLPVI